MLVLSPYTSKWNNLFHEETQALRNIFGNYPITFHHIGSTAIPGCAAKPIIDILGVTSDLSGVDAFNKALEERDYISLGEFGMKRRRFFKKPFSLHLHIFEDSNPEVARHLGFRDYLRTHPEEVVKYSELKRHLINENAVDINRYTLGKESFIKEIDYKALSNQPYWNKKEASHPPPGSSDEIIAAMEANMQLTMTYFAKYLPIVHKIFEPDVLVVQSSLPDETFNHVIDAQFNEQNVAERVKHVINLYQSNNLPFTWWVSERDRPNTLVKELEKQGLKYKEDDIGMFLHLDQAYMEKKTSGLLVERVLEPYALQNFAKVMMSLGRFTDFLAKIPPTLYGEGAPYEMYIGYVDKIPVVTGVLVLHAQVGGIYYLMTNPAYRKKGYGTEMVLSLLRRAK